MGIVFLLFLNIVNISDMDSVQESNNSMLESLKNLFIFNACFIVGKKNLLGSSERRF